MTGHELKLEPVSLCNWLTRKLTRWGLAPSSALGAESCLAPARPIVLQLREERVRESALEVTSACARWAALCPSECWVVSNTSWSAPAGPAVSLSPLSLSASDSPAPDKWQSGHKSHKRTKTFHKANKNTDIKYMQICRCRPAAVITYLPPSWERAALQFWLGCNSALQVFCTECEEPASLYSTLCRETYMQKS